MLTVEESIVINKPRSEVAEFFNDPVNVPLYCSNIVEYEQISGETHEVGREDRGVARVAGRKVEFHDTMVEYEPDQHAKMVADDATIPYSLDLTFADQDGGTKVTWHQESESFKGLFKFADPIVLRLYARDVKSNLENAKTILES